jgi:hypothetical protein
MADSDVVAALDACASDASRAVADADAIPIPTGLTTRSRKRVIGR